MLDSYRLIAVDCICLNFEFFWRKVVVKLLIHIAIWGYSSTLHDLTFLWRHIQRWWITHNPPIILFHEKFLLISFDFNFVYILAKVKNVFPILFVEIREVTLVSFTLSCLTFLILFCSIQQSNKSICINQSLATLMEKEFFMISIYMRFQGSFNILNLWNSLLKKLFNSIRWVFQVLVRNIQDSLVVFEIYGFIKFFLQFYNIFWLLKAFERVVSLNGFDDFLILNDWHRWIILILATLLKRIDCLIQSVYL